MFTGMRRWGRDPEIVTKTIPATFNAPLRWAEPKKIFTCSWSDFFHRQADPWREDAWDIILRTPQHTYQILTKRPGLAVAWAKTHPFPDNVWLGTSVESAKYLPRLTVLSRANARVMFGSFEPLLSELDLTPWLTMCRCGDSESNHYQGVYRDCVLRQTGACSCERFTPLLSWGVDGGESGANRRPANPDWFRGIRDACLSAGVPYFHKQGNDDRPGKDSLLDGREWREFPS